MDEIAKFADVGYQLDADGPALLTKLATPHPRYPGRVNCKKEEIAAFMERLDAHLTQAAKYRADFKGQPGEGVTWNSVKGWCQEQHR